MRRSEFQRAVDTEFGARAASVTAELTLGGVGYRTAAEAIADGVALREVWLALCVETDIPESRRHGAGRLDPRRT